MPVNSSANWCGSQCARWAVHTPHMKLGRSINLEQHRPARVCGLSHAAASATDRPTAANESDSIYSAWRQRRHTPTRINHAHRWHVGFGAVCSIKLIHEQNRPCRISAVSKDLARRTIVDTSWTLTYTSLREIIIIILNTSSLNVQRYMFQARLNVK